MLDYMHNRHVNLNTVDCKQAWHSCWSCIFDIYHQYGDKYNNTKIEYVGPASNKKKPQNQKLHTLILNRDKANM